MSVQRLLNPPISNENWKRKLQIDNTSILNKRWIILGGVGKPADVAELDLKKFHNELFTYEEVLTICKTDSIFHYVKQNSKVYCICL